MFRKRRRAMRTASWSRSFRQKHRTAYLGLVVTAVILAMSLLLLATILLLAGREPSLTVAEREHVNFDAYMLGSGVSLRGTGDINLIENPSFEPYVDRTTLSVSSAYSGTEGIGALVSLGSEDSGVPISNYRGASFRLLRQDETARLQTIRSGEISGYRHLLPQEDLAYSIGLEGDKIEARLLDSYIEDSDTGRQIVLVGESGLMLVYDGVQFVPYTLNFRSNTYGRGYDLLQSVRSANLLAIERIDDTYYILTEDGEIYETGVGEMLGWTYVDTIIPAVSYRPNDSLPITLLVQAKELLAVTGTGELWRIGLGDEETVLYAHLDQALYSVESKDMTPMERPLRLVAAETMGDSIVLVAEQQVFVIDLIPLGEAMPPVLVYMNDVDLPGVAWQQYLWQGIQIVSDQVAVIHDNRMNLLILDMGERQDFDTENSEVAVRYLPYEGSGAASPIGVVAIGAETGYYVYASGELIYYDLAGDSMYERFRFLDEEGSGAGRSFAYAYSLGTEGLLLVDRESQGEVVPLGTALLFSELDAIGVDAEAKIGDLLILERSVETGRSDLATGDWVGDGELSWESYTDERSSVASRSGRRYVRMTDRASLTQELGRRANVEMTARSTYHLRFQARESVEDSLLIVRIGGPFETVELTFNHFSRNWQSHAENILIPSVTGGDQPVTIELELVGGSIDIDDIYLAQSVQGDNIYRSEVQEGIREASPDLIRFEDLAIGRQDVLAEAWLLYQDIELYPGREAEDRIGSLEAALRLARSASASPWLVIDSYATYEEARALMNYLAASPGEAYGDKRMANGTAVPWMSQFDQVIIEVTDRSGIYRTDSEKAGFADSIFDGLKASPYYQQNRHKIVLIDSMSYQEGYMLSAADYHAAALAITDDSGASFADVVEDLYLEFQSSSPRIPHLPSRYISNLIHEFRIEDGGSIDLSSVSAAEQVWAATRGLEQTNTAVLMSLDYSVDSTERIALNQRIASLLSGLEGATPIGLEILDPHIDLESDNDSGADWVSETVAYGLSFQTDDGQISLLLNTGKEAKTIAWETPRGSESTRLRIYDRQLNLQSDETYKASRRRIFIPAGSVVLIDEITGEN